MRKSKSTIWSKTFILLFLLTIFDQMAFLCTRAIISKYALDLGLTETRAGIVAGALSIAALFSRPVAGRLLGPAGISKKKILMGSVVSSLLIIVTYMLVKGFVPLMLVRILNGITYGISGTVELTMASDSLDEKVMGRGIAVFGLGNIISLAFAPSVSVYLYDTYSPKVLFGFCLFTSLIAVLIVAFIPDGGKTKVTLGVRAEKSKKKGLKAIILSFFAIEALEPAILNFASQVAYASISAFIVVYGGIKGWNQIALFYTVYSFSLFIFKPVNGKLYDKRGLAPLVILGNLSFAFGIFLIGITDSFGVCLLAAVFCAYGYGGAISTFQAEALKSTTFERHGIASGTYFMFNDLGGFLGASMAGIAVSAVGYSGMYLLFTIPLLAAIVFYWCMRVIKSGKLYKKYTENEM
ncbi:MAG: MFS transporter [Lachnospiraceae bacterium]|nr:MFS transporter [Lachnospiraceae bacterium]MDE6184256.1 MFS transporter [Lachnospiraceae bacterium]